MNQPPTNFMITRELLEKVANYLALRPYGEVAPLLADLAQCRGIAEVKGDQAAAAAPSELRAGLVDGVKE